MPSDGLLALGAIQFNSTPPFPHAVAVTDGDGDTDQADLGLLLANWGEGCL